MNMRWVKQRDWLLCLASLAVVPTLVTHWCIGHVGKWSLSENLCWIALCVLQPIALVMARGWDCLETNISPLVFVYLQFPFYALILLRSRGERQRKSAARVLFWIHSAAAIVFLAFVYWKESRW